MILALGVLDLASGPEFSQLIHLEDLVAGGDGSGNAPAANVGGDPRSGQFRTDQRGTLPDTDGVNPQPVDSPCIDSVFRLKGRVPSAQDGCSGCLVQYGTQSNVQLWLDDSQETNQTTNFILKNLNGGVKTTKQTTNFILKNLGG